MSFTWLHNLILIFSGILLSLSVKLITDDIIPLLSLNLWQIILSLKIQTLLTLLTLLYFLDDVIENAIFISVNPYSRGTGRLYLDLLTVTCFYFCVLLANQGSKYYLLGLAILFFFNILWSFACLRRNIEPEPYIKFIRLMHFYGGLLAIGFYTTIFLIISRHNILTIAKNDIIIINIIFLFIWLLIFEGFRAFLLRNGEQSGIEYALAGMIIRPFLCIIGKIVGIHKIHGEVDAHGH